MTRTRTSSAWLILWGGLLFLSFRPVPAAERVLEFVLAPLRGAAALGAPFGWLRAKRVQAAEHELAGAARAEAAEGSELLARLASRALPADAALRTGRHYLTAEVVSRSARDECWLALREVHGVVHGAPVVCGDAYLGRVVEVVPGPPARARVQLVTAAEFRVGAVVQSSEPGAEPVFLTVGGIRVPRAGERRSLRLAAHQPSSSAIESGLVRVHELFADAEATSRLAEGFRLGELRKDDEHSSWWVEPELDFLDGLFQVAIVSAEAEGGAPALLPALQDGNWLATTALTGGDPSPWRSTLKVALGRADGLREGAAVTGVGARLVGRVCRVGLATSDVALLADPGQSFPVLARLAGESEPAVLGRVLVLGRGAEGTLRLRWFVRVPLAVSAEGEDVVKGDGVLGGDGVLRGDTEIEARLFTGSGDPGLPGGLFLGSARLPRAARAGEEREFELRPGLEAGDVRTLFVRREAGEP
ncbi:MAG: hypothetical protein EXS08_01615 [Planctomycetes bacterium]|nr:hypothetical protein [Planctomycetota bacterium]